MKSFPKPRGRSKSQLPGYTPSSVRMRRRVLPDLERGEGKRTLEKGTQLLKKEKNLIKPRVIVSCCFEPSQAKRTAHWHFMFKESNIMFRELTTNRHRHFLFTERHIGALCLVVRSYKKKGGGGALREQTTPDVFR